MKLISFALIIPFIVGSRAFRCGVPNTQINKLIVQGRNAMPGSFPWHAAVYHWEGSSEVYTCGGTLISYMYVLTSEHCVKDDNGYVMSAKRIFVRLGIHNRKMPNLQTMQHHAIFKIHRTPDLPQMKNDIALLELSTEAVFNEYVQPVCINREENFTGQLGIAVGWGMTEDDELSDTLKAAEMPVVNTNICLDHDRYTFGQHLGTRYFCAGHTNGTAVCNGDSGGGLHVKRGDVWYIVGIISFSVARNAFSSLCKIDSYTAFTSVAAFVPWIRNVTELLSLAEKGNVTIRDGEEPDPARLYPNHLPRQCGNFVHSKMFEDTHANMLEIPWIAVLMYNSESSGEVITRCRGSLINKRYVLTAARCVYPTAPFQVRLGEYDLSRMKDCNPNDPSGCAPPVQDVDIDYIVRHKRLSTRCMHNDIALVRLTRDIYFSDHIQPICLPVTQSLREQKLQKFIITGFGQKAEMNGKISKVLMKITISAISHKDCQQTYDGRATLDESHMCAGSLENKSNVCQGDSGGPLGYPVRYDGVRFVQFGITSFGMMCNFGVSVFTNVSNLMEWILANMHD